MTIFTPDRLMVEWERDGFRIEMYETGQQNDDGSTPVGYRLYDERFEAESITIVDHSAAVPAPIFEGVDLSVPRHVAIDSGSALASLLTFLSLRPGDTDSDYFDGYTERQWRWMERRAEDLALAACDLTEAAW